MEGMEETKTSEAHLTSPAAFVEGGIQDACDDACSICLEAFCDSDPSTVTNCKHEFHLQCILEWCQRSSQCPMCWQPISLKDPTSQELLEAVERERSIRFNPPRNSTIFHHLTLGDFELQHLPMGANDAELEERIIQHLAAAAAAMERRHVARRDGPRNRSSGQGRPHFLVFSSPTNAPHDGPISSSPPHRGGQPVAAIAVNSPTSPPMNVVEESLQPVAPQVSDAQLESASASASGSSPLTSGQHDSSFNNRRSPTHSSPNNQDRAGPSELQSFSESIKSKFNAVSLRYKESISKSTRGWKERFFSRSNTMADHGSEVRKEVNAGIASVSRMMERLDTGDNHRTGPTGISVSNSTEDSSASAEPNNQQISEVGDANAMRNVSSNVQDSCSCAANASSGSDRA